MENVYVPFAHPCQCIIVAAKTPNMKAKMAVAASQPTPTPTPMPRSVIRPTIGAGSLRTC